MIGKDNNFENIIAELQSIHIEFPDMRFGLVIQIAADTAKRKRTLILAMLVVNNCLLI